MTAVLVGLAVMFISSEQDMGHHQHSPPQSHPGPNTWAYKANHRIGMFAIPVGLAVM